MDGVTLDRATVATKTAARAAFAPAAGVAISVRGLSRAFGAKTVLSNIDLDIPAGQFVAVVGKSGCGKSTLLRLLVGLDTPTDGSVQFADTTDGPKASRIMFQEPRLLPWARVAGNVEVGTGPGLPASARREVALAALAQVGLEDRAGEWPAVLSGGQKQRVALARALVSKPRFLALDEPLGALDALTRIGMQSLIETVWREQGFTAVLVTHDVGEAVALADRILLVDEGRIAADIAIEAPRPRRRGDPMLAAIEGRIIEQLLGQPSSAR